MKQVTAPTALNPFVVGGAIGGQNGRGFVGRDDIFSFVTSALMVERRAPILLHGQRRIGKSSILKQIPRRLPDDFACVYFDLQGTAAMKTDQLLYGLGLAIADKLNIAPPEREDCIEDRFPGFMKRAVQSLDGHEERLVLLFDEFDVIDQSVKGTEVAGSRFIPYLAHLINLFPNIGYVMVVGRKTEELSPEFLGSLLKDAVTKQIGRLTESQIKGLARDLAGGHLRFDEAALDRICFLTNGHPFCTQALCNVIWTVAMINAKSSPVRVTRSIVDRALPEALELWSNGLNWVYDGMSKPAHRVLLSALAEVADPLKGRTASQEEIDAALRPRHMTMDGHEFAMAVSDLLKWDILVGSSPRLAFAVPMIGAWIAKNRALEMLRGEAALLNPRAQRYYELAIENLAQNNYEAAIGDFRNALAASPNSLDAMRGLARALSLRRKQGDLREAVEAYERLLELEPQEPRTALIEMLTDRIDQGGDAAGMAKALLRLRELDPNGPYLKRATRRLTEAAQFHETRGSGDDLQIAELLCGSMEDISRALRVTERIKRLRMWTRVLAILAALFAVLAVSWGWIDHEKQWLGTFRGLFSSLSGVLSGLALDDGATSARRRRALWSIGLGCLFGGGVGYWFQWTSGGWAVVGYIAGLSIMGFTAAYTEDSGTPETRIGLTEPKLPVDATPDSTVR